jgi:hypothetical protein
MTLQLPLQVIFVIVDDTLVGDRDKDLLSLRVGEVVNTIEYMIVQAKCPLEFEGAGLTKIVVLGFVF